MRNAWGSKPSFSRASRSSQKPGQSTRSSCDVYKINLPYAYTVLDLDVGIFEKYDVPSYLGYWWWQENPARGKEGHRDEGRLKLARVLQAVQIKLAEAHTKTQKRLTPKKVNFSA
jgi:hypothetical protein